MLNKFCKKPLYEVTRTMARVAMGVQKAETVIKNARLVNVCTAEIQEGIDVAIAEGPHCARGRRGALHRAGDEGHRREAASTSRPALWTGISMWNRP